jgi:hypothetical protein
MPDLTATSELDVINAMLDTISEAPVATLIGPLPLDAQGAQLTLHRVSRSLQTSGWDFNREPGISLSVDVDGRVPLPSDALNIDFPQDPTLRQRGSYAYDALLRTDILGRAITADLIVFRAFDDLPNYAREYIAAAAVVQFKTNRLGADSITQADAAVLNEARVRFMQIELEYAQLNAFDNDLDQRLKRNRRTS